MRRITSRSRAERWCTVTERLPDRPAPPEAANLLSPQITTGVTRTRETIDIVLRRSDTLSPAELDEIWKVTERYIETDRAIYEGKLRALPEVALWRTRSGDLVGLVSLDVYRVDWQGRRSLIFFTSSVVIDERFRGRNLVLRTGVRAYLREKLKRPWEPAFWFFDTFSYKSYLILPRNLAEFWPRVNVQTPPDVARFIDHLARRRYGDDWSSTTGVVRRSGHKRLRATTAPIDASELSDPDVRFFERANPGHRDGDMLVCIAPLSVWKLLRPVARSFVRRFARSKPIV
jgi:hypothetical protein